MKIAFSLCFRVLDMLKPKRPSILDVNYSVLKYLLEYI